MKRTQIYLTEEQAKLVADRAADAGLPKAEVIRRLLDEGLGLDSGGGERRLAITSTAGIIPEASDWPQWLAAVRSGGADERLHSLER